MTIIGCLRYYRCVGVDNLKLVFKSSWQHWSDKMVFPLKLTNTVTNLVILHATENILLPAT